MMNRYQYNCKAIMPSRFLKTLKRCNFHKKEEESGNKLGFKDESYNASSEWCTG